MSSREPPRHVGVAAFDGGGAGGEGAPVAHRLRFRRSGESGGPKAAASGACRAAAPGGVGRGGGGEASAQAVSGRERGLEFVERGLPLASRVHALRQVGGRRDAGLVPFVDVSETFSEAVGHGVAVMSRLTRP
jgi:hypothetical protein